MLKEHAEFYRQQLYSQAGGAGVSMRANGENEHACHAAKLVVELPSQVSYRDIALRLVVCAPVQGCRTAIEPDGTVS